MNESCKNKKAYLAPQLELVDFRVESGYATTGGDSPVTPEWTNSFTIDDDGTWTLLDNSIDRNSTNQNEQYNVGWGSDDFWGS